MELWVFNENKKFHSYVAASHMTHEHYFCAYMLLVFIYALLMLPFIFFSLNVELSCQRML